MTDKLWNAAISTRRGGAETNFSNYSLNWQKPTNKARYRSKKTIL
jgi:hypothetical protein